MKKNVKQVKMCPNRDKYALKGQVARCAKRFGIDSNPCPDNSTQECELFPNPPKAKAKVRRVKAWACKVDIFNNFNMGFRVEFKKRAPNYVTPCTILIDEKWFKGGK